MKNNKVIAAGVLPICTKTGRVLLIRRGFNQPKPGTWATFGGKYEEGADLNPKDNAMREFVEESGYHGKFKISNKPLDVLDSNHLRFYTFIGLFDEEFIPDLEKGNEAIDYGWFYYGEFPEDLHPGVIDMLGKNKNTIEKIICFFYDK
jgi:ADP-ribose pyrophosphatase YjhB (NUDIX family)